MTAPGAPSSPLAATTAVYALTPDGVALGRGLADALGAVLFAPRGLAQATDAASGVEPDGAACEGFDSLGDLVRERFFLYRRHVFVAAAGIVVRLVGPLLRGKGSDPAVVVVDQAGRFAISLVSGHLGGANALARDVAAITGGEAVITTATDVAGAPAVDLLAQEAGLAIADLGRIKAVNAALAAGRAVQVHDPQDWLGLDRADPAVRRFFLPVAHASAWDAAVPGVVVTHEASPPFPGALALHPPCLCAGVGCRKGADEAAIAAHVSDTLAAHGLTRASLAALGSIEAKRDEAGLTAAAARLGVPIHYFDADALNSVSTPHVSPKAKEVMGVSSVCEAAALLLAKTDRLLVDKTAAHGVTVAVALRGPDAGRAGGRA
ncbi:MAG: cobalt-precorrin 5A hydrolase [Desulfovibrionaceae bacterium]